MRKEEEIITANTPKEVLSSSETESREKLETSVLTIIEYRRKAEQNQMAAGAGVAAQVLLKNIPTLGYIVDGGLLKDNPNDLDIATRIQSLPSEFVEDSQRRIDDLLSIADAVPSVKTAKRLATFLPVTLPQTKEGCEALRSITKGFQSSGLLPENSQFKTNFAALAKVLRSLDRAVVTAAREDGALFEDLRAESVEIASIRLPELIADDSKQIKKARTLIAQRKLRDLRRKSLQTKGAREYSLFEILANEIIEEEDLENQVEAIVAQKEATLREARVKTLGTLVKRRATRKVMSLIEEDPLLCQAVAKQQRMAPEELLEAEESTRKTAANNALSSRKIILSIEERRAFNGDSLIADERKKLEEDLTDPLVFIANLPVEDLDLIRNLMSIASDRKTVFDLAKDRLRQRLEAEATESELIEVLAKSIAIELLDERCAIAVDSAVQSLGLDSGLILADSQTLLDKKGGILPLAIKGIRRADPIKIESQKLTIETEQPKKPYEFTVPLVTIGKSQLISPVNLLRFGTTVTMASSREELAQTVDQLIASSPEFEGYFCQAESAYYYSPEKKAEMLFSMVGRGAGSKLAGTPLFELDGNTEGISIKFVPERDADFEVKERYGARLIGNSVRLSPLMATVGQPYTDRLIEATRIVAGAVDTVSGNLNVLLENDGRKTIPVEEVTTLIRNNFDGLLNTSCAGNTVGRGVIQMDFFLLYSPERRRAILETFRETGTLDGLKDELAQETQEGKMNLAIFDVSGGSGGVGISEILSQRFLGKESGHMQAYLDTLLGSYQVRTGRLPVQIIIAPREADLTLMNFEYTVVEKALLARGIPAVGITTLELLQQSLEVADKNGSALQVPTLKGEVIAPELIIKRFTFPGEGKGNGYRGDVLAQLPNGVVLEPSNGSRIVASDKRVNSPILEALTPQLAEQDVEVMPYLELDIEGESLEVCCQKVVDFMKANRNAYPEIDFLGAVLKTGDKIPGRETTAGEVISAYPVPAGVMRSQEMQGLFIAKKIRELILKGITGIIVQPNVLSLVVDKDGNLLPKFELKMMAFANQRK